MAGDWVAVVASGCAALIGALLAPQASRLFKRRDRVLELRSEWARDVLTQFRLMSPETSVGAFPYQVAAPPIDLELMDSRSTSMVYQWLIQAAFSKRIDASMLRELRAERVRVDPGFALMADSLDELAVFVQKWDAIVPLLGAWARGSNWANRGAFRRLQRRMSTGSSDERIARYRLLEELRAKPKWGTADLPGDDDEYS